MKAKFTGNCVECNDTIKAGKEILKDSIILELKNGRIVEIEKVEFSLMDAEGKAIATAKNYPLTLAYATTIHKSQGSTLDQVMMDLRSLWEPGQAYVALSRLSQGAGLKLQGWQPSSIKVDPAVQRFHQEVLHMS